MDVVFLLSLTLIILNSRIFCKIKKVRITRTKLSIDMQISSKQTYLTNVNKNFKIRGCLKVIQKNNLN